jgi:hypothetical protein
MWDVSTSTLEAQAGSSEAQGDRWERVLNNPDLLEELRDYFTLAQIKAQGEECMEPRSTSTSGET